MEKKNQLLATQTEPNAQSIGQSSGNEEPNSNSTLIERTPIEGTPFTHVTSEKLNLLTLGKFKLVDLDEIDLDKYGGFGYMDKVMNYIEENKWNLITDIIGCMLLAHEIQQHNVIIENVAEKIEK